MPAGIPDHVQQGLDALPMQLRGKPKLEVVLRALLRQVQELEDATLALLSSRDLNTASGAVLDQLGRLVGENRVGRLSDAEYRLAIQLRIQRNNSRGEPDRLIRVLRQLSNATGVLYEEPAPGLVRMTFDGNALPADMRASMEAIAPVGVRLELVCAPTFPFAFSSVAQPNQPSNAGGFGATTNSQTGGGLSWIP